MWKMDWDERARLHLNFESFDHCIIPEWIGVAGIGGLKRPIGVEGIRMEQVASVDQSRRRRWRRAVERTAPRRNGRKKTIRM